MRVKQSMSNAQPLIPNKRCKRTNLTPRISLSTPLVTPKDANRPSGSKEVVLLSMLLRVSIADNEGKKELIF